MRVLAIILFLVGAAAAATYFRYESLHPCDWMEHDLAEESGLPRLATQVRMRALFALEGIAKPNARNCVQAWWSLRLNGPPRVE